MAIQYIHFNKILHRDLKSQNVFMTKKDGVKLGKVIDLNPLRFIGSWLFMLMYDSLLDRIYKQTSKSG